ncbi:uncharacterized protein KY384_005726 [Bacidia gigantensis]|uniref:uncharacterized protein n=1 Tax=Bacidia gigantensis TaxID=2732470 RepID=UPI001D03833C|nr:uncharacterized protein KY384_005726 [Bacidia gigantensis]KAG8529091.1 hypothetical protein KY384_005726 [Bacidia gigantensis]
MFATLAIYLTLSVSFSAALPQAPPSPTDTGPSLPTAKPYDCGEPGRPANIPCSVWIGAHDQTVALQEDPNVKLSVHPLNNNELENNLYQQTIRAFVDKVSLAASSGQVYNQSNVDYQQSVGNDGGDFVAVKIAQTLDQFANVQPFTYTGLNDVLETLVDVDAKVESAITLKKGDGTVMGQGCISTSSSPNC